MAAAAGASPAAPRGPRPALPAPQEDLNVDDAFQTIARNALKNESEEELYIPETVDVNAQAAPRRAQSSCC